MKKFLYKYSYYIISVLFMLALFFALIIRDYVKSELSSTIINYGFWYCFGLLSGYSLAIYIFKNYGNKK